MGSPAYVRRQSETSDVWSCAGILKTLFLGLFVIEQKYQSLCVFFPSHTDVKVCLNDISPVDFSSLMT